MVLKHLLVSDYSECETYKTTIMMIMKTTTTTTPTEVASSITDVIYMVSNFRMISISSLLFQMKRLVERMVWLSLLTPLNSLS